MLSLLLGRSSLKLRESLYLTKRQTIYRSDRNSVRCRTFPATSASQEIACECQMPSPLEDRIRELCLKAAVAQNEADLDQIIRQLRAALTEYIHDARIRAVEVIPRTFRSDKKTA